MTVVGLGCARLRGHLRHATHVASAARSMATSIATGFLVAAALAGATLLATASR